MAYGVADGVMVTDGVGVVPSHTMWQLLGVGVGVPVPVGVGVGVVVLSS